MVFDARFLYVFNGRPGAGSKLMEPSSRELSLGKSDSLSGESAPHQRDSARAEPQKKSRCLARGPAACEAGQRGAGRWCRASGCRGDRDAEVPRHPERGRRRLLHRALRGLRRRRLRGPRPKTGHPPVTVTGAAQGGYFLTACPEGHCFVRLSAPPPGQAGGERELLRRLHPAALGKKQGLQEGGG